MSSSSMIDATHDLAQLLDAPPCREDEAGLGDEEAREGDSTRDALKAAVTEAAKALRHAAGNAFIHPSSRAWYRDVASTIEEAANDHI
jgi:hypothetical protein